MKKIILLFALGIALTSCSSDAVYICTGRSSRCYHIDEDCRGLRNCGGQIKEVTLEEAEGLHRRPCKICY